MRTKKLISVFLFLVLSIQLLPLQQIAAWLSSNTMTEEIAHSVNPVRPNSVSDEIHPLFSLHSCGSGVHSMPVPFLIKHHQAEALHIRHADDILSPPPNC